MYSVLSVSSDKGSTELIVKLDNRSRRKSKQTLERGLLRVALT